MDDARDDNITACVLHRNEENQVPPDCQRAHPLEKLTTTLAAHRIGRNPVEPGLKCREVPKPRRLTPDALGVAPRILKVIQSPTGQAYLACHLRKARGSKATGSNST